MAHKISGKIASPSLFPFLSILVCTAGVLAFIILAIGTLSVVAPSVEVKSRGEETSKSRKQPLYVECHEKHLLIHPEKITVPYDSIGSVGSEFMQFLRRVAGNAARQYVVFAIYPDGVKTFRQAQAATDELNEQMMNLRKARPIDIGYEPLNYGWRLKIKESEANNETPQAGQSY